MKDESIIRLENKVKELESTLDAVSETLQLLTRAFVLSRVKDGDDLMLDAVKITEEILGKEGKQ